MSIVEERTIAMPTQVQKVETRQLALQKHLQGARGARADAHWARPCLWVKHRSRRQHRGQQHTPRREAQHVDGRWRLRGLRARFHGRSAAWQAHCVLQRGGGPAARGRFAGAKAPIGPAASSFSVLFETQERPMRFVTRRAMSSPSNRSGVGPHLAMAPRCLRSGRSCRHFCAPRRLSRRCSTRSS